MPYPMKGQSPPPPPHHWKNTSYATATHIFLCLSNYLFLSLYSISSHCTHWTIFIGLIEPDGRKGQNRGFSCSSNTNRGQTALVQKPMMHASHFQSMSPNSMWRHNSVYSHYDIYTVGNKWIWMNFHQTLKSAAFSLQTSKSNRKPPYM